MMDEKAKVAESTPAHALELKEETGAAGPPVRYRPGRRDLTPEIILPWVARLQGNISAIADALGTSRTTIYSKIKESEELRDAIADERERTLDTWEESLHAQVLNGSIPALIFALKTQGRSRGYGDKLEVEGWTEKADRSAGEDAAYLAEVLTELKKLSLPKGLESTGG